jgi:glycosyltransferase involved in cell wall biosynthesis
MTDNMNKSKAEKADDHIVSVVISTVGRDSLSLTQAALQKQTRMPDEVVTIFDEHRMGSAWGRNRGILRAKGDLIAFIDDDCIPPSDWLESLIRVLDRYQADGVGGTYKETDPFLDDIRKRRIIPNKESEDTGEWVGLGGNVMYTKRILGMLYQHRGYYYNEDFLISQDWEIAWHLRKIGAKFIYVPTAHKHLKRVKSLVFLKLQFGRGMGIANLYDMQRYEKESPITVQKSLLWSEKGTAQKPRWLKIILLKLFGPFDVNSFRNIRNFILFWLGEKFQGLGFVWMVLKKRLKK